MKMLVDVSSVIWHALFDGKDGEFGKDIEVDGKKVHIPSWHHGYENAFDYLVKVMQDFGFKPTDILFVVEGANNKAGRLVIDANYKAGRDSRTPEMYESFNTAKYKLVDAFREVGSQSISVPGVESDDVIAWLTKELNDIIFIVSNDRDLAALCGDRVSLIRKGTLVQTNPYGDFPFSALPIYKALVGDSSDNIKGAPGFGDKAFSAMFAQYGMPGVMAIQGMIQRKTLHELEEDVAEFKPFRKVVDGAESVYRSYELGLLHPEWVNIKEAELGNGHIIGKNYVIETRLIPYAGPVNKKQIDVVHWKHGTKKVFEKKNHAIFDVEIIGKHQPVFLVCVKILETGEKFAFWHHRGDMDKLEQMFMREDLTFVSFNGIKFDEPLISAAICGKHPELLKPMATEIVEENTSPWQLPNVYGYIRQQFDHIDLYEVAPGVKISLKTYAGRMSYPTMVDLPFEHDEDINEDQQKILEEYCFNDIGVTEELFQRLREEINLRVELGSQYDIDLRSKSDAQCAEAIMRKVLGLKAGMCTDIPESVRYNAPDFIKSDNPIINDLIAKLEAHEFIIDPKTGSPVFPDFLKDPIKVGYGTYQFGLGGLHSTHDSKLYAQADEVFGLSDWDVASYYPNIIMRAGFVPKFEGEKGKIFLEEYGKIYRDRMVAKARAKQIETRIAEIERILSEKQDVSP